MNSNVLVVDDDDTLRGIVVRILSRHGFEVETAQNGVEALAALREGFRGVVLLDYTMPELDGYGTLKTIKEERLLDGITICMLTGLEEPTESLEELGSLVVNYITKPFSPEELISAVQDAAELASDLENTLWLP